MMLHLLARSTQPVLSLLAESSLKLASVGSNALASQVRGYAGPPLAIPNTGIKAGPGGRSSVTGMTVTIFGANGFVGSYITNEVAKSGSQVVCPYRSVEIECIHLKQMGDLGQLVMLGDFSIRNDDHIKRAISRSNVVINLIGMRTQTKNFNFHDVHVDFPSRLARICAEAGHVDRLIHFSDMAANENHKSKRLASKALGDKEVMANFPDATILRPGPISGVEDYFYNYIIFQLIFAVAAPLIDKGRGKVQPTWIIDVASAVMSVLCKPETKGKTYYLGGPEVLTVRELYDKVMDELRVADNNLFEVPSWFIKLFYSFNDALRTKLPLLPMQSYMKTRDYVEEVISDRSAPPGTLGYDDLDIKASSCTEGMAVEMLRHYRVGGYGWGDVESVSTHIPERIRNFHNITGPVRGAGPTEEPNKGWQNLVEQNMKK